MLSAYTKKIQLKYIYYWPKSWINISSPPRHVSICVNRDMIFDWIFAIALRIFVRTISIISIAHVENSAHIISATSSLIVVRDALCIDVSPNTPWFLGYASPSMNISSVMRCWMISIDCLYSEHMNMKSRVSHAAWEDWGVDWSNLFQNTLIHIWVNPRRQKK